MAKLVIEGDDLVVRLSPWERVGALRSEVRIPVATVRDVRATDDPWSELRGIRAPGTGIPGMVALCTRRGSGIHDFAAVYGKRPAVVIEAEDAPFDRLVICCPDAQDEARRLAEAMP
jgi:hypothetical protein